MLIEPLGRHLAVGSAEDAEQMLKRDRNFWNVISIRSSHMPPPALLHARAVFKALFDDADRKNPGDDVHLAHPVVLRKIFNFYDTTPGEPILVHCRMGISRSTGVALCLLARAFYLDGLNPLDALDWLGKIRPQARPNVWVLKVGLETWLPPEGIESIIAALREHPVLSVNYRRSGQNDEE